MKPDRFLSKEIIKDPSAEIKHFIPENGQRDRFGNRFFPSEEFGYLDNAGEKVKAGMLVSAEGENFIKKNRGILKTIAQGLAIAEPGGDGQISIQKPIKLDKNRTLECVQHRTAQSNFYILNVANEKYAIKTHKKLKNHDPLVRQPYINEMLQTQSVALDLKKELASLKLRLASFLFASGQVSCTRYEESADAYDGLDKSIPVRIKQAQDIVSAYIEQKKKSNYPLWTDIHADFNRTVVPHFKLDAYSSNFRLQSERGEIVWIDPFKYQRPVSK